MNGASFSFHKEITCFWYFQIFISIFIWNIQLLVLSSCYKMKFMDGKKQKVIEAVKSALDGRTQRWLALEIKMPEDNLSKRMQGVVWFTQSEIDAINERLGSNIELPEVVA